MGKSARVCVCVREREREREQERENACARNEGEGKNEGPHTRAGRLTVSKNERCAWASSLAAYRRAKSGG